MYKRAYIACITALLILCFAAEKTAAQVEVPEGSLAAFCSKLPRPEWAEMKRLNVSETLIQQWFEVYEVATGVTAIYEPFQWQEVISYLIQGEDKALLFDTGNGLGDISALVASLTEKPIAVVNSHTHYDHVGGNHAFDTIYGMNTDFTRANQRGVSNEDIAIEAAPAALCRALPEGVTKDTHVGKPFEVTHYLEDGAIIDLGGRQLEVIHIAGHAPDAIALIDRENGLLWTGDSYYHGPIWLFAPETDLDAYKRSLDRLVAEAPGVKALLPAHNTPWVDPGVLIRVKAGFQSMLSGNAEKKTLGEGMVEYRIPGEDMFSFLMRDEPIPYAR